MENKIIIVVILTLFFHTMPKSNLLKSYLTNYSKYEPWHKTNLKVSGDVAGWDFLSIIKFFFETDTYVAHLHLNLAYHIKRIQIGRVNTKTSEIQKLLGLMTFFAKNQQGFLTM